MSLLRFQLRSGPAALLLTCVWLFPVFAEAPDLSAAPPTRSELFLAAQTAYDEGRYDEAGALYTALAEAGVDNVELHYNHANACFRSGDLPDAVRRYRTAWYRAPRDPDIRANLHFALNAAGAVDPAPGRIEQFFFMLTGSEWIAAAVAGYGVLTVLLALALFSPAFRRLLLTACILPALLLLLSGAGWHQWRGLRQNPEWVVSRTGATALYGPIDGTTAHYKVPMGALVRQRAIDPKGWVEIEYDGMRGWLRQSYIERVSP